MITPFRKKHIITFFEAHEESGRPALDLFLNRYLRAHKSIGSNDRKVISDTIYEIIRYYGFVDIDTVERFLEGEVTTKGVSGFPPALYQLLIQSIGKEKTEEFSKISNNKAPVTIRVNKLKTTREALIESWKGRFEFSPCEHSETGINFQQKINFYILPEFLDGHFEIQDEGSQLLAGLATVKPGEKVLDYCAGAGGKSLAIAPSMKNQGQLFLHDIRRAPLESAKKRLKRAGVQNYQMIFPEDSSKLNGLKGNMDLVFVDVPCSGSGTWRRNPDQKWKFTPENLENLLIEQRDIFQKALVYLKPKGRIVYATCSIFPEENEHQIERFIKEYNLKLERPYLSTFPTPGGMDGFFGAVLVKKDPI